jgi:putative Holliday junction resolvase
MIIMSVDYGDKRTGIAICDKLEILASPVCVLTEWNCETLADKIIALATEKNAQM